MKIVGYVFYGVGMLMILHGLHVKVWSPDFWWISIGFGVALAPLVVQDDDK